MSLRLRAVAYQPNGARLGVLPAPQNLSGSMVFGDVGSAAVTYPVNGPKASLLATPCEVALEVSYDNGATWSEPDNARYLRLRRKGDQVEAPGLVSYECPSYVWLLDKSKVLPEGKLNADGKRPFLTATTGTILTTLVAEAKARGELPGLDVSTFTAAKDSSGADWDKVITLYYEPGLSYLAILLNLQAQGMADFTMSGRTLKVYRADTTMAGASGAVLRRGRDLTEAPYTGTLEGLATYAFLMGDNGATFERANAGVVGPWGRWTTFISQGGVSDTGTMTVLTDSALALAAAERVENTYGLDFTVAKALPFRDYSLGRTIGVTANGEAPVALRLRQITLTSDEHGRAGGNVVLNDRFLENEVRQNRRIQGITGGSSADGGSGSRPADGKDTGIPSAPTGLTVSSTAYLDDDGKVFALVGLNWAAVTTNTNGTAVDDLARYEPFWRRPGDTTWNAMDPVDTPGALQGGFQPGTAYQFVVRAVDNSANKSALSAVLGHTTAVDATAPPAPSTPIVASYLGQLLLRWDGTVAGGGTPPLDFARLEFHLSTVNGFVPSAATLVDQTTAKAGGGASTVASGLTYGTTYYARLVMYDRSGNASPASVQASGVPQRLVAADIGLGAVARTNLLADIQASLGQLFVDDFSTVDQWGGAGSIVSTPSATAKTGANVGVVTNYAQLVGAQRLSFDPSQLYRVTLRVRKPTADATATVLYAGVRTFGADGVTPVGPNGGNVYIAVSGATVPVGSAWVEYVGYIQGSAVASGGVAPNMLTPSALIDTTRYIAPLMLPNYNATTGGQVTEVDLFRIEAVPTGQVATANILDLAVSTAKIADLAVASAKIADLAVGTAKIAALAVTDAKVNDLAVAKLTAGSMSAAITVSGRIATALTGARVELNNTGLKAYNASGVNTVAINTDGSAVVTGTYQTGTTGRRLEISSTILNNGYTGDGAHSLKWFPAALSANWTAAGVFTQNDTASTGASGAALILQSSSQTVSPFGGGSMFLGMKSAGFTYVNQSAHQAGISIYDGPVVGAATTVVIDIGSSADSIQIGNGPATVTIYGGVTFNSGGLTAYDSAGAVGLAIGNDGAAYFKSVTVHNRTSTFAANVGVATSPLGVFYRLTSSRRYKVAIQDAPSILGDVRSLRPRTYVDKGQYEENGNSTKGLRTLLGLIAEEVAELPVLGALLVPRNEEGAPESVDYDRVAVALIPWLRDLDARLTALETVGSAA